MLLLMVWMCKLGLVSPTVQGSEEEACIIDNVCTLMTLFFNCENNNLQQLHGKSLYESTHCYHGIMYLHHVNCDCICSNCTSCSQFTLFGFFLLSLYQPQKVEGANILTRSLVIFGQGLVRSHPNLFSLIS